MNKDLDYAIIHDALVFADAAVGAYIRTNFLKASMIIAELIDMYISKQVFMPMNFYRPWFKHSLFHITSLNNTHCKVLGRL